MVRIWRECTNKKKLAGALNSYCNSNKIYPAWALFFICLPNHELYLTPTYPNKARSFIACLGESLEPQVSADNGIQDKVPKQSGAKAILQRGAVIWISLDLMHHLKLYLEATRFQPYESLEHWPEMNGISWQEHKWQHIRSVPFQGKIAHEFNLLHFIWVCVGHLWWHLNP